MSADNPSPAQRSRAEPAGSVGARGFIYVGRDVHLRCFPERESEEKKRERESPVNRVMTGGESTVEGERIQCLTPSPTTVSGVTPHRQTNEGLNFSLLLFLSLTRSLSHSFSL